MTKNGMLSTCEFFGNSHSKANALRLINKHPVNNPSKSNC